MTTETRVFDVMKIRRDFPILSTLVYGKPLVYFDNAATSQKPRQVIDAITEYYTSYNANIHRGVHALSQKASQAYDEVRGKVQRFINAGDEREIIFTSGTTASINLVSSTYGRKFLNPGDEILISSMEHHSNLVPWQMLCMEKECVLKVIPMTDSGELIMEEFDRLLTPKVKLISIVHTSNSLGTINPVKEMIAKAKRFNIPVLVDGAQAVVHEPVDVRDLGCDFFAFSGHKMLGPTGVGVLYGRMELLEAMPPWQGGGDMIRSVSLVKTEYNEVPYKFEAGTPNVADVIGLGAAIDYMNQLDRSGASMHEERLLQYATEQLRAIDGVKIIGSAAHKTGVLSFIIDGVNAMDAGMYLDTLGVAVRTGHHCTEPVMDRMGVAGTIRASFLFYNTTEEVNKLIEGVKGAIRLLRV